MAAAVAIGIGRSNVPSAFLDALRPALDPRTRPGPQIAVDELAVLGADLDVVLPPEAVSIGAQRLNFNAPTTSGDHLRLQQATALDAPQMRASLRRVLRTDLGAAAGSSEAVMKEARLHRLLRALDGTQRAIKQRTEMVG